MNKRKVLALSMILILSISVIAFGDNHVTKVEAFLAGDLNFNVDGEQWSPKDVDGSDLTPIIYKDRTYIPVRSLLEDKGVTVGYEAESRTVLLDYSTINVSKPIDKASPLLMTSVMINDEDSDGDGIDDGYQELTLERNSNFEVEAMEMTQEMNFDLSEKVELEIDGRMIEGRLDELFESKSSWDMKSAVLSINQETGAVEKMSISTIDSDEETPGAAKLDIKVEVSWPPWKVKVTINF